MTQQRHLNNLNKPTPLANSNPHPHLYPPGQEEEAPQGGLAHTTKPPDGTLPLYTQPYHFTTPPTRPLSSLFSPTYKKKKLLKAKEAERKEAEAAALAEHPSTMSPTLSTSLSPQDKKKKLLKEKETARKGVEAAALAEPDSAIDKASDPDVIY